MLPPSEGTAGNLGIPNASQPASFPPMRASNQDRDETVQQLQAAFAEGRLDEDEFDTRVRTALGSHTQVELAQVTADLLAATVRPAAPTLSTLRKSLGHLVLAVMGSATRRGRWRVPAQCIAVSVMGSCLLDLRAAQLSAPVTTITAVTVMGGVEVLVPPGVRVEVSGLPLMGSCRNKVRQGDLPPDAPLVRVRGMALMGGIVARTTTSRRTRKT